MENRDAIAAMREDLKEATTNRKDEKLKKVEKTLVTDAGIKRHKTSR